MRLELGLNLGSNKVGSAAVVAPTLLSDILSGVVFELDLTNTNSYSGSGNTVANLTPTPADGSAKAAYNFTKSAGAVFTGSAGASDAHLLMDGSGYLTIGANTTFLSKLHRTDAGATPYTLILVGSFVPKTVAANPQAYFGTALDGPSPGWNWNNGLYSDVTNRVNNQVQGNWADLGLVAAGPVSADSTERCLIMTHTPNGSNGDIKFYSNSSTPNTATHGFQIVTADATFPMQIGAAGNNLYPIYNGGKVRIAAMLNRAVNNTEAASILSNTAARTGFNYGS